MLKQACVADLKAERFDRSKSHLVVTMRFDPRFLRKELRDEFIAEMAPEKELLMDFNAAQKRLGDHNSSFAEVDYEQRFRMSDKAKAHLKRLAKLSNHKDVYLTCVCRVGERCHREILMLIAHELYGCQIDEVFHAYPIVMRRVVQFRSAE